MTAAAGLVLALSLLCGLAFGWAAQRGSICVVQGVIDLLDGRSGRLFLSFLKCSLWVAAISLPAAWLLPGLSLGAVILPSLTIAGGALLFGLGAALNGGCAFGTLMRLGAGELSFLGTIFGMGVGVLVEAVLGDALPPPEAIGASPLGQPTGWALALVAVVLLACARELALLGRRTPPRPGIWAPERAVLVMGIAGGLLYAFHGSWAYTLVLDRSVGAMMGGTIPNFALIAISVAALAGSFGAAWHAGKLKLRLNFVTLAGRIGAGALMGFGAALIPGGNDALVLHALPVLSPHAPVAYGALVLGVAAALLLSRALRRSARLAELIGQPSFRG